MTGERTGYRGVVLTGTACASLVLLGTCVQRCHVGGGSGDSASAEKEILDRSRVASPEVVPASGGLTAPASSASTSLEELRARRAELAKLPLAERVKRAKTSCAADGCPNDTTDDLLAASKNDAERDAISKAMAPFNARPSVTEPKPSTQKEREAFADIFDTALLSEHQNPEGVHAYGKTLHVDGWFCSRQWIFEFANGDGARDVGFTRVECSNGVQSWGSPL